MTRQKKLKKTIRARSRKTGESYTAARRQVLEARRRKVGGATLAAASKAPPTAAPPRGPSARPRRQSEASVIEKTGHGLDHWFAVLDAFDATKKGHTASAAHLYEAHGVPGWHSQMITVAYERERGLRAMNQTSAGDFQVSITKSLPAAVAEVADAIGRADRRRAWLRGADPALSRALNAAFVGSKAKQVTMKSPTHARLRFRWDRSTVEIHVYGKPKGGSSIVAANTGLERAELVEQRRAQWKAALEALKSYLTRERPLG
jgi:hypothetical protein